MIFDRKIEQNPTNSYLQNDNSSPNFQFENEYCKVEFAIPQIEVCQNLAFLYFLILYDIFLVICDIATPFFLTPLTPNPPITSKPPTTSTSSLCCSSHASRYRSTRVKHMCDPGGTYARPGSRICLTRVAH